MSTARFSSSWDSDDWLDSILASTRLALGDAVSRRRDRENHLDTGVDELLIETHQAVGEAISNRYNRILPSAEAYEAADPLVWPASTRLKLRSHLLRLQSDFLVDPDPLHEAYKDFTVLGSQVDKLRTQLEVGRRLEFANPDSAAVRELASAVLRADARLFQYIEHEAALSRPEWDCAGDLQLRLDPMAQSAQRLLITCDQLSFEVESLAGLLDEVEVPNLYAQLGRVGERIRNTRRDVASNQRDVDKAFLLIREMVENFRYADLRSVDLIGIPLEGIRWNGETRWPHLWEERIRRASVEEADGTLVILSALQGLPVPVGL
ncbi:hypothetical protein ACPCUV_24655 [Streptomyces platensis]|uniref:hypothetical protein n=1 Tax=Streptomyces platensis TaxID=58346 RepID=UPI003C2C5C15